MKISIHPHAIGRMKERGCTRPEIEYTVKHGVRSLAKYDRTRFTHSFAYNRRWMGKVYRTKKIEAYAVEERANNWLVITVIVKYG